MCQSKEREAHCLAERWFQGPALRDAKLQKRRNLVQLIFRD